MFGWTGNMERLAISNAHQKSDDPQRSYYLNQKKTLEINPRHPLIKELLRRVEDDPSDPTAKDIALMMFRTGMDYYCNFIFETSFINTIVFNHELVNYCLSVNGIELLLSSLNSRLNIYGFVVVATVSYIWNYTSKTSHLFIFLKSCSSKVVLVYFIVKQST
jgi:hypothetical protein